VRKNVFNLALSRHKNVKWKHEEVKTTSHCDIKNVRDVELKTSSLDISQLPDPMQGFMPCPLDISPNSQCSIENIFPHALSRVVLYNLQLSELENFGIRGGEWDNSCFTNLPRATSRMLVGEDDLFD
jgi:hypothetical protein